MEAKGGCCSMQSACCCMVYLMLTVVVAGLVVFTYRMNADLQALKARVEGDFGANGNYTSSAHTGGKNLMPRVTCVHTRANSLHWCIAWRQELAQKLKCFGRACTDTPS